MTKAPLSKMATFRQNIRRELAVRGMTQVELARRSGLSHIWLCKMLNGRSNPTLPICERIAQGLGTSLENLVAD